MSEPLVKVPLKRTIEPITHFNLKEMSLPITVSANLSKTTHNSTPSMSNTINVNVANGTTDIKDPIKTPVPLEQLPEQDNKTIECFEPYPLPPAFEPRRREMIPISPADEARFKDKYIQILIDVINSPTKTIKNRVEPSQYIIMSADDLTNLIALISGINDVQLAIDEGASCLGRVKLIHDVSRILVNGLDLQVEYNHIYNRLLYYHVSLKHVLYSE